uniref:Ribonuclease Oy n=1 Tax=Cacopsylla melanoneura TaxID=428564 RepID=A0A8D8V0K4_9HEMI
MEPSIRSRIYENENAQLPGFYSRPPSTTWIVTVCFFVLTSCVVFSKWKRNDSFDVLIYTQSWPNTVCLLWEEKSTAHVCYLPPDNQTWTIHGIWPTKLGTIGPVYCNKSSMQFNASQLAPIQTELEKLWTDIYRGRNHFDLWKHEYIKHGSCARVLPPLNSELKYFSQGITWQHKYNMETVLATGNIFPSTDENLFDVQTMWLSIKTVLGKNPAIECIHDPKSGLDYLMEIRICFTKELVLTDCDGIKSPHRHHIYHRRFWTADPITNCPLDKSIVYPSKVPSPERVFQVNRYLIKDNNEGSLVSYLKTISFLNWMTI